MPGDVVLGRNGGVVFIPAQLAERVVQSSEITHLRDTFGHQRLREGKYTAGQIDAAWSAPIETEFTAWLRENREKLPVAKEQVDEILKHFGASLVESKDPAHFPAPYAFLSRAG